jgi:hypothetical protein
MFRSRRCSQFAMNERQARYSDAGGVLVNGSASQLQVKEHRQQHRPPRLSRAMGYGICMHKGSVVRDPPTRGSGVTEYGTIRTGPVECTFVPFFSDIYFRYFIRRIWHSRRLSIESWEALSTMLRSSEWSRTKHRQAPPAELDDQQ